MVDDYFVVLEKLGERVEALEDELVTNPTAKRRSTRSTTSSGEMIFLRKSVWPLREVVGRPGAGRNPR